MTSKKRKKEIECEIENPLPDRCPICGLDYDDFRSGYTFADARQMMFSPSPDESDWPYKRRHGVLGKMHQLKQSSWADHLAYCEQQEAAAGSSPDDDEVPF
jgi:hypothetical protein